MQPLLPGSVWPKSWLEDSGLCLGRDTQVGELHRLSASQAGRHTLITGQSGTGKTMMMAALILQHILRGASLILIDLIGTLAPYLKQALAASLLRTLVQARSLPPSERRYHLARVRDRYEQIRFLMLGEPCGEQARFAPFERVEGWTTLELASSFAAAMERVLEGELATMRALGLNLTALASVLIDAGGATPHDLASLCCMDTRDLQAYLKRVEARRRRGELRIEYRPDLLRQYLSGFFAETSKQRRADLVMSTLRALNLVLSDPIAGKWLSSPRGNLGLGRLMRKGGVLIVSLPSLNLHTQRVMGGVLLGQASGLALRRDSQAVITGSVPRVHLVIDEFQRLFTPEMAQNIAVYRNKGLLLTLAHQSGSQDPFQTPEGQSLLHSIADNTGNKVTFRVGPTDTRRLGPEYFLPQGQRLKRDEVQPFYSRRKRWQQQTTARQELQAQERVLKRQSQALEQSHEQSREHVDSQSQRRAAKRQWGRTHTAQSSREHGDQTTRAQDQERQHRKEETQRRDERQQQQTHASWQQQADHSTGDHSLWQQQTASSPGPALTRNARRTQATQLTRDAHGGQQAEVRQQQRAHSTGRLLSRSERSRQEQSRRITTTHAHTQRSESQRHDQREQLAARTHTRLSAQRSSRQLEHQHEQMTSSSRARSHQEEQLEERVEESRHVREYYSVSEEQVILAQQLQTLPNRTAIVLEQGAQAPRVTTIRTLDLPMEWTTRLGGIDALAELEKYCTPQVCEPAPTLSLADRLPAGLRRARRKKGGT